MTQTLFKGGENGYASYRIPVLLALPGGRVLAFCEGRVKDDEDYGEIHTIVRASADGKTFSPLRVVAKRGADTVGNPTPVYDRDTGRLFLFMNDNLGAGDQSLINQNKAPRGVMMVYSDDLGETWSQPADLTARLKPEGWTWYACGPCHGLQTRAGRLVIPCCHGIFDPVTGQSPEYRAHMLLSDDHGKTWRLGGDLNANVNETAVAELPDGRVFLSARMQGNAGLRVCAYSVDGGESWGDAFLNASLPDPRCQGAVIWDDYASRLLHLNNPYPFAPKGENRRDITLKESRDGGLSWKTVRKLCDTPSAYGDLAVLDGGRVACLYECGEGYRYERIDYQIVEGNAP